MPIPHRSNAQIILLTDRHYVLAELTTFGRRLSDLVNDPLSSVLEVEQARVNRAERPDEQLGFYPRLVVKKDHIHAVLVISEPPRQTQQRLATYIPKTPVKVSALLPVLMISGSVHLAARLDPALWTLDASADPFVAVSGAEVTLTHRQGPPIPVQVALVNRHRIVAAAAIESTA